MGCLLRAVPRSQLTAWCAVQAVTIVDQVGPGGLLTDVALYLDVDQTQIVPQAVPPVASPTNIENNNNNTGGQGNTNNNNNNNGGGEPRVSPEEALQQLLMPPTDVQLPCPDKCSAAALLAF